MSKPTTIILGGGLAGLSAAEQLGSEAQLYEQREELGGLCQQVVVDGFRFDAVPHVLHFQHEATRLWMNTLLGGGLQRFARCAGVYSHGTYIRYPFQAHLFGLPPSVIDECVQARLQAGQRGQPDSTTFGRWIRSTFGDGIANHFMEPYNRKFWTLPTEELTCEWLDGLVPVPSLTDTLRGASRRDPSEYGYNVEFWYPGQGGLGAILQAFLRKLPEIRLAKRLVRLDTSARRLQFSDGEELAYDHVLSSIPLPEWKGLLDPLPEAVADALDRLRWTSLAVLHLGIQGTPPVPWHWIYVPGSEIACYRVGIPSHYAPDAAPPGHYILSVEISHAPWRVIDPRSITAQTIRDLVRMGLVRHEREIAAKTLLNLRYGYPIYDHHYRQATTTVREHLERHGVHVMGRFGSWRYLSMEQTLLDGQRVAQSVLNAIGDEALSR